VILLQFILSQPRHIKIILKYRFRLHSHANPFGSPVGKIKAKIRFLNFSSLILCISLRKDFLRFRLSKDFQRQISAKCRRMREKFSLPFIATVEWSKKYAKEIFEYRRRKEEKCLMGITIDERALQPSQPFSLPTIDC
jgi:hypothetical protein